MFYNSQTEIGIHDPQLTQILIEKLRDKFWLDRSLEMIRHICTGTNTQQSSGVKDIRISHGYPSNGSMRFTRCADGKRFKAAISANNHKWICQEVQS